MSTTTGQTSTIYVGQIAVDMHSGQKQLVWRGVASKTIDTKAKPEKQQKNLAKATNKLFKNYPPPVKKSSMAACSSRTMTTTPTSKVSASGFGGRVSSV